MEKINLRKILENNSYVGHLITQANYSDLKPMLADDGYNVEDVELVVTMNGYPILTTNLEPLLEDWTTRLADFELEKIGALKERVALLSTEEGLIEKAKELAKEMCYDMAQKFEWN